MPRIRDLGIYDSELLPGPHNAITDVDGVAVGHFTLISGDPNPDDPAWQAGSGPFRTGVTIILPHRDNLYEEKVSAAVHTINGFGKVTGFEQVRELGHIETPIALTGTMNVPRVADALITLALETSPHIGLGFADSGWKGYASINPVVGETSDGYLSDMQARPIGLEEVRAALNAADSGPVAEGAVGAGTGTSCYGWKGGIGTASRVLPERAGGFTIGALVQSNFGRAEELTVSGVPVGRVLRPPTGPQPDNAPGRPEERGSSIMIILATDAPLDSRQLGRLCHRAAFGLARTGSTCHGGSGDFVITFSTARRIPDRPAELLVEQPVFYEQPVMSALSLAVIESVEEAIYNSLLMAETVIGRQGHVRYGLPADKVAEIVRAARP
ncbi:MAG: P1 family peptidase [Chloroflexota bacterium]